MKIFTSAPPEHSLVLQGPESGSTTASQAVGPRQLAGLPHMTSFMPARISQALTG